MMAEVAARWSGQSDISADDVVLALAVHGEGVAYATLRELGVDSQGVLNCFDDQKVDSVQKARINANTSLLSTTETSPLVRKATAEADTAGHEYVGTEHLLIAAMQQRGTSHAYASVGHGTQ